MENKYDVAVIGSGPAGYTAAIRASQLGAKVLIVEKEFLGGTCLNYGCIPTKILSTSCELLHKIRNSKEFGIKTENTGIDFNLITDRKEKIIRKLRAGISGLFKSHKIEVIAGEGKINLHHQCIGAGVNSKKEIFVNDRIIKPSKIIIATGSVSVIPKGIELDDKNILDTKGILDLTEIPKSLVVIGGGVIGCEFAEIFAQMGCNVTIVETLPRILSNIDEEISNFMTGLLKNSGVKIITNSKEFRVLENNQIEIKTPNEIHITEFEKVLVSAGRKPDYTCLSDEIKDSFEVNNMMETNIKDIYAAGDITGKYFLANVSSAESIVAAENACGKNSTIDYSAIPNCIFTHPEIATVGLTEKEAEEKGYKFKIGKFPFKFNSRAIISGDLEGFVKVIADGKTEKIIGVHIIGPDAVEIIHSMSIAIKLGATLKDLDRIIFAHPTLSETIHSALSDVNKSAIDLPK